MNFLKKIEPDACTCKYPHQVSRRWFMRSLVPSMITISCFLPALPAKAIDHNAKALVLSCIDFRFLEKEHSFLLDQDLKNQYDWTALAGASLALASARHTADTDAFWNQLDLSYSGSVSNMV